jgi:hypothetical protein
MTFSIVKLLGGFAFWKGDKLGKLIYYLLIISACLFAFYKLFIAPTNVDQSSQQAETITNITQIEKAEDSVFIGIKVGGLKLGLRL